MVYFRSFTHLPTKLVFSSGDIMLRIPACQILKRYLDKFMGNGTVSNIKVCLSKFVFSEFRKKLAPTEVVEATQNNTIRCNSLAII